MSKRDALRAANFVNSLENAVEEKRTSIVDEIFDNIDSTNYDSVDTTNDQSNNLEINNDKNTEIIAENIKPAVDIKNTQNEEDVVISNIPVEEESSAESIENKANEDKEDLILERQTFYITPHEREAIACVSYDEQINKSELVRLILDAGLEALHPGILLEVDERVQKRAKGNKLSIKLQAN